jgi:hypothetical protein
MVAVCTVHCGLHPSLQHHNSLNTSTVFIGLLYDRVHECIYSRMSVCMCVCMFVYLHMFVRMHVQSPLTHTDLCFPMTVISCTDIISTVSYQATHQRYCQCQMHLTLPLQQLHPTATSLISLSLSRFVSLSHLHSCMHSYMSEGLCSTEEEADAMILRSVACARNALPLISKNSIMPTLQLVRTHHHQPIRTRQAVVVSATACCRGLSGSVRSLSG